jgi:hypothetical protein
VSMDTTIPALPPNAAQETGGNLDGIKVATARTVPDLLAAILLELQITNALLVAGFGRGLTAADDQSLMRQDTYFPM